jgi:hypothetical protein
MAAEKGPEYYETTYLNIREISEQVYYPSNMLAVHLFRSCKVLEGCLLIVT